MNNSQLAVKLNIPIWLKILAIGLIGLGIFFRFADLGQKLYWGDECFTSLAISGHTLTEVKQEVFNRQEVFPITTEEKTWRQKVWQFILVGVIIAGLVSDPKIFKAESWWPQAEGTYILEVARVVNQTEKLLLIINNSSISVGTTLALSHRLEPKVKVLSLADDLMQGIPQGYSQIFLLHSNNSLFHQLEEDKTYSLTYSLQLPGADGGFWRFEKLPSRTGQIVG